MNIEGRKESVSFLLDLFIGSLEGTTLDHPGQKTWLVNKLMSTIISPRNDKQDFVSKLKFVINHYTSQVFKLGEWGTITHSFEVNYDTLKHAFDNNKLTTNIILH